MAAIIKFVKPEHVEILNDYLSSSDSPAGIALVYPDQQAQATKLGLEDGEQTDYDFGGDADVWLDKVNHDDHYLLEEKEETNAS